MAARKAMVAVSSSRISPTRMMSGSWRRMARIPELIRDGVIHHALVVAAFHFLDLAGLE